MRYVLDANVALKWVLDEPYSAEALRLRSDFRQGRHEILAPDVYFIEVAHALARAERRQILFPPQGMICLMNIHLTPPRLYPYLSLLPKAYDLASRRRVGVYDCLYVVLAERERCELLTADDRLVRALGTDYPFITPLSSLP